MKQSHKLKNQRAELISKCREQITLADSEDRNMTSEEVNIYENIETEIAELESNIERHENLERQEATLDKIDERIDTPLGTTFENTSQPPASSGVNSKEYREAFKTYMRGGKAALNDRELRAMEEGTDSEGGYAVSGAMALAIQDIARQVSFVWDKSHIEEVDTSIKIPFVTTAVAAEVVAEEGSGSETDPALGGLTLTGYVFRCLVKASWELQNSLKDLGGFVSGQIGQAFGQAHDKFSLTGSGSAQPRGIINTAGLTSTAGATTTTITADNLIECRYNLNSGFDQGNNICWAMAPATLKAVRSLTDDNGQFLWTAGLSAAPDQMLGFPVFTNTNMPALATGNISVVLFNGDYHWVAWRGMSMLYADQLYAANAQVAWFGFDRWDSGLTSTSAAAIITQP